MSSGPSTLSLGDAAKAFGDLIGQGTKIGFSLLDSVKLPLPTRSCGCNCDIPPPCWEPQPIGDVTTKVCPGNKAVLRLHVANCGSKGRTITVEATDKNVTVSPSSVSVAPYEEQLVLVSLDVPAEATEKDQHSTVVWVRGCYVHYLRWRVDVTCRGASCCNDAHVSDCPDLVHHWYDHFYCDRPCPHQP
jgi:hypothetical protein